MKKIGIITGASSGMGRDFALQIAKDYSYLCMDELWLVARRIDKLKELADNINSIENAAKAIPVEMDISGSEGAEVFNKLLSKEKEAGDFEITVLVNNAGFGTYGPFSETPVEKEMQMIDLNCTALTGITGYALPF